jgi:hypothetical protein
MRSVLFDFISIFTGAVLGDAKVGASVAEFSRGARSGQNAFPRSIRVIPFDRATSHSSGALLFFRVC